MRLSIVDFLENSISFLGLTTVLVDRFKSFDISCLVVSFGCLSAVFLIIIDYEHLVVIAAASLSQSIISSLLLLKHL